ncbi:MAG TPA: hypothetical protein VN757_11570 [Steroidobacteraceae bacterium]|nr:hypothetical protein [Steroidobacteraceae bacterium]
MLTHGNCRRGRRCPCERGREPQTGHVNSGQVCRAIKRIYAQQRIYEVPCEALAHEAQFGPLPLVLPARVLNVLKG